MKGSQQSIMHRLLLESIITLVWPKCPISHYCCQMVNGCHLYTNGAFHFLMALLTECKFSLLHGV